MASSDLARSRRGRQPVSPEVAAQIDALFAEGKDDDEIAAAVGLARETVCRVRNRPPVFDLDNEEHALELAPGQQLIRSGVRCPGCGAKVKVLPCLTPECVAARRRQTAGQNAGGFSDGRRQD